MPESIELLWWSSGMVESTQGSLSQSLQTGSSTSLYLLFTHILLFLSPLSSLFSLCLSQLSLSMVCACCSFQIYLSYPASSGTVERLFSAGKLVISNFRTKLKADVTQAQTVSYQNRRFCEYLLNKGYGTPSRKRTRSNPDNCNSGRPDKSPRMAVIVDD